METIVSVIRQIVRDELRGLHIGEVGTVTSVFPIDGPASLDNHACSVMLRDRDVELRQVPIATPHVGLVSCPQVGDLVLIAFIGGNQNDPVVIGRLHSESVRPPVHADGELVIEAPPGGDTRMRFLPDGAVVITAGDAECRMQPDGVISVTGSDLAITATGNVELSGDADLTIAIQGDANVSVTGNTTVETADCTINASGNISLGEGGGGVITDKSHKCYFTGAPLVGSRTVTAKE